MAEIYDFNAYLKKKEEREAVSKIEHVIMDAIDLGDAIEEIIEELEDVMAEIGMEDTTFRREFGANDHDIAIIATVKQHHFIEGGQDVGLKLERELNKSFSTNKVIKDLMAQKYQISLMLEVIEG